MAASKPALKSVPAVTTERAPNSHGGAREGAGRKPKSLLYASEIADAENQIITALPDIIAKLIEQAKTGDVATGRYLVDRVLGRVKEQAAPLADDQTLPYTEEQAERERANREASAQFQDELTKAMTG